MICVSGDPVLTILKNFYTTAILNIITWNTAYSLFPHETFRQRKTYPLIQHSPFYGDLLSKYGRRGWQSILFLTNKGENAPDALSLLGQRRFGDSMSWKINLPYTGDFEGNPSSVLNFSFFQIQKAYWLDSVPYPDPPLPEDRWHYEISAEHFRSCVLQHEYLFPGRSYGKLTFWTSIAEYLNFLTSLELSKLPWWEQPLVFYDEQPKDYFLQAEFIILSPPKGWKFYDEHVQAWFDAFLTRQRREGAVPRTRLTRSMIDKFRPGGN